MSYPADRTGHGRWCTITSPAAGVLWEADNGSTGFQPAPVGDHDPAAVTDLLDTCAAAGRTATEAFDQIARLAGAIGIRTGNLDGWQPDSQRPIRATPPTASPEAVAALASMLGATQP